MPYDDDDDLFGEEFDFVDEDDVAGSEPEDAEKSVEPKPRRRSPAPDKSPPNRPKGRSRPSGPGGRRNSRPPIDEPVPAAAEPEPVGFDAGPVGEDVARPESAPAPTGPPSDHVVHIYEFGKLKRTIPRKFTDEEAVGFAEEYTRTGKAYGRYAVATPEDEEPAPTFAGASRGR
jgi:hypothetical protein